MPLISMPVDPGSCNNKDAILSHEVVEEAAQGQRKPDKSLREDKTRYEILLCMHRFIG